MGHIPHNGQALSASLAGATEIAIAARDAAPTIAALDHATRAAVLRGLADCFEGAGQVVQMMNAKDVSAAKAAGFDEQALERIRITSDSILRTMEMLRDVAGQPDPIGSADESRAQRHPRGLVLIVHHAEPMFTVHAFARCFKAGNACIIKGGDDACESSITLMKFIQAVLEGHGLPMAACSVPSKATPQEIDAMRAMHSMIDATFDETSDLSFEALTKPRTGTDG